MTLDALAFLIGVLVTIAIGAWHQYGLLQLKRVTPDVDVKPRASILTLFSGLLALHLTEIAVFAGIYAVLLQWPAFGECAATANPDWADLLYFAGINFATLGYTQMELMGPLRLMNMVQSLCGFMIITWSATFIYSVWGDAWRRG